MGSERLPFAALVPYPTVSRLDTATKLVRERRDLWVLKLYPTAGEAGGSFRWIARDGTRARGRSPDVERARQEAERRARGKLRRYATANGLNRLVTCTYRGEGCHDPRQVRTDLGLFFRRLRASAGGAFPYAWVPEWHKSGHGLHIHAGVGNYMPKRVLEGAWGQGFVDIRLVGGREGADVLQEARVAAAYLAKYVGKDVGAGVERGLHRYEVAQGFQPAAVEFAGVSAEAVLAAATEHMGGEPELVWRPDEDEWDGPPVVWARWARARRDAS